MSDIILRACAYKREQRYQTAEEFLAALSTLSSSATPEGLGKTNNDTTNAVSYATVPALNDNRPRNISFTTQPAVKFVSPVRGTYETVPAEGSAALASARMKVVTAAPSTHTKSQVSEPMPKKQVAISEETTPKTIPLAMSELKKAASEGDAAAQYQLGHAYAWGEDGMRDNAEAVKWYKLSAAQGYIKAQEALGYCYMVAKGVEKDEREVLKWYEKAADQGSESAKKSLLRYYLDITNRNKPGALRWFAIAAEQGNADAMYYLAERYYRGNGTPKDPLTALKLLHNAKKKEHWKARSLFNEIAKSENDAFQQFQKWCQDHEKMTVDKGGQTSNMSIPKSPEEQFNMGSRYFAGDGVQQNYMQAVQLFQLAAKSDHIRAMYMLGVCCCYGLGVSTDHIWAAVLFQKQVLCLQQNMN